MTKQFAVIGNPIEHSRSPELYHAFANKLNNEIPSVNLTIVCDQSNIKTCVWFKVYSYLINMYFIRNKMIVQLLYTDQSIAVFKSIRNNKIVVTRLDDFVKSFSILNYKRNKNGT